MNISTVVLWQRIGPYHLARLNAAVSTFSKNNINLKGVEICPDDNIYNWTPIRQSDGVKYETLFPGAKYEELSRSSIRCAVMDKLEAFDPEVVAINGWSAAEAKTALEWCKQKNRTAVLMSESKEDDFYRLSIIEYFKRRTVRKFDSALVGGEPHKLYSIKLGVKPDKVFAGYDVVDNDYFIAASDLARNRGIELRNKYDLPEKYFIVVARFVEEKNLFRLIDAYKEYKAVNDVKAWGLVICGSGPLEEELKIYGADIEGIKWMGFRQINELPEIYAFASAFILPSTREPWGLVLNEAMACRLPVLVSSTAGCRYDLLKDGENGFLFDPYKPSELTGCMKKITSMPEDARVKMGKRSRDIISDWGPGRFGENLLNAVRSGRIMA